MKYMAILVFITLSTSCKRAIDQNSEITQVELDRSGAWSDYGGAIIVDSSLNYKYRDDNIKDGSFIGKVNKRFGDTLNQKLRAADFKTVDSTANMHTVDAEYFELIIHWKNERKRIVRLGFGKRDSILKTCIWLDNSYKNVKLHQTDDSIKFEGEFQKMQRPPVIDIKVNPPTDKKTM